MRRFLMVTACLAGSTSVSLAADLPVVAPEPAVVPFTWDGFYAGLNVGWGFSAHDFDVDEIDNEIGKYDGFDEDPSLDVDGIFGGGQIGYNMQWGGFVGGIEVDFQGAGIEDDADGFGDGGAVNDIEASVNLNWFGTVRGRVGFAADRTLFYATGGFAFGDVDFDVSFENGGGEVVDLDSDDVATGWVVGGGIEHAFADNWTAKVEYQFIDFGDIEAEGEDLFGESFSTEADLQIHTVRVGVNYKF